MMTEPGPNRSLYTESKSICPRCGSPITSIIKRQRGGRVYLYAYHGGRECYLGPADRYVHAEKLHVLGLASTTSTDYLSVAREAVTRYVRMKQREYANRPEALAGLSRQLKAFAEALLRLSNEIEIGKFADGDDDDER